jgi:hypothetical protein
MKMKDKKTDKIGKTLTIKGILERECWEIALAVFLC